MMMMVKNEEAASIEARLDAKKKALCEMMDEVNTSLATVDVSISETKRNRKKLQSLLRAERKSGASRRRLAEIRADIDFASASLESLARAKDETGRKLLSKIKGMLGECREMKRELKSRRIVEESVAAREPFRTQFKKLAKETGIERVVTVCLLTCSAALVLIICTSIVAKVPENERHINVCMLISAASLGVIACTAVAIKERIAAICLLLGAASLCSVACTVIMHRIALRVAIVGRTIDSAGRVVDLYA